MKKILSILIFFCCANTIILSQSPDSAQAVKDILQFQDHLNSEYLNPKHSPLDNESRSKFKQHEFFPINLKYRVKATLEKTPDEPFFELKTSSGKTKLYRKYGELNFKIDGRDFKLNVYQGKALLEKEEYKNYLFLPFTDLTTGNETYGGGRYIDMRIPEGDEIIIDFNKAYNPYCAYSDKFNCPIVPAENFLDTEIRAGTLLKNEQ